MNSQKNTQEPFPEIKIGSISIGVGQIALGILVILIATLTTWLTVWVMGFALVIWGGLDLYGNLRQRKRKEGYSWWRMALGILSLAVGLLLVIFPEIGAASLSLVLAILFLIGGIHNIIFSISDRPPNWGWAVLNGGISLFLGFFILGQWPINNFMVLGILIGIEIIMNGWTLAAISYTAQKVGHHPPHGGTAHGAT